LAELKKTTQDSFWINNKLNKEKIKKENKDVSDDDIEMVITTYSDKILTDSDDIDDISNLYTTHYRNKIARSYSIDDMTSDLKNGTANINSTSKASNLSTNSSSSTTTSTSSSSDTLDTSGTDFLTNSEGALLAQSLLSDKDTRGTTLYTSWANSSSDTYGTSLGDYGVFNMPHQFTKQADPRSSGDWKGRSYNDHILNNTPLVIFKVGKPNYMNGVALSNSGSDSSILQAIMDLDEDNQRSYLETLFNGTKENVMYYYTFKDDFANYCDYVNAMVRYLAVKMDLTDYKHYNLYNETVMTSKDAGWFKSLVMNSLGVDNFLAFYAEGPSTTVSESGSNTTGDSQLASSLKTIGQAKRELDFIFGGNSGMSDASSYDEYTSSIQKLYGKAENFVEKVLNKVSGVFSSVSSGANVLFPEIWQDSAYKSSNCNIEIKLSSPYGDKQSIFQNIFIPFLCLLAMTLPRQSGRQGYVGPFLVQVFSKGYFSCNLGMVDSLDVKKGGSSGLEWSIDDLPTAIDVTLSIKDLTPTMIGTAASAPTAFGNNLGLCEYLKVLGGVQLTDFDPVSNIEEAVNFFTSGVMDIPTKIYQKTTATLGKGTKAVINKIFGGIN
jgi:hypothetical protein